MNGKELMLDTLTHVNKYKIAPLWELEFHLWSKFSQTPFIIGCEFEKLSTTQKNIAIDRNIDVFGEVCNLLGFSAVNIPCGYWELAPGDPAYYWLPNPYRDIFASKLIKAYGSEILFIANTGGVMAMPEADNYLEFSYKLFDDPDSIDQMAKKVYDNGIISLRKFRDMGYEATIITADMADNHGPFFAPDQMDRFILPYLNDYANTAHSMGICSILHTDGNINKVLDVLADSGIDAIQSIDPVAGMDIENVHSRYADRLTICGNVDCGELLTGTPEDVYKSSSKLLTACGDKGGFVFGASNAVQIEVPKENYLAMNLAWRKYTQNR